MSVHEENKTKIAKYLTEVGAHLRDVGSDDRRALLSDLNKRIHAGMRDRAPSNGQDVTVVEEVLEELGSPALQAAQLRDASAETGENQTLLGWNDRVWLGVCSGISQRIGIDPNFIRLLLVVLGFVPPLLPFMMVAYLGFYAVVYAASPTGALPRLRYFPVVRRTAGMALGACAIYGGGYVMLLLFSRLSKQVLGAGLLIDGRYNWLLTWSEPMLFWALVYVIPIAVMSAMPVRSSWAGTLEKVAKAALVVYAIAVCVGLAYMLAGLLIDGADQFGDSPGTDAIWQLFQ